MNLRKFGNIIKSNVAGLMVDAAIAIAKKRKADYGIIKLLISTMPLPVDLDEYSFDNMLLDHIKEARIFPNVNRTYITYKQGVTCRYSVPVPECLSGSEFEDLLLPPDDLVSGFLSQFDLRFYKYEYLCNSLDSWTTNIARELNTLSEHKRNIVFRQIAQVAVFYCRICKVYTKYIDKSFDTNPSFFFNVSLAQIKGRKTYYFIGDKNIISPLPKFVDFDFINPVMLEILEDETEGDLSELDRILFPLSSNSLTESFNEITSSCKSKKALSSKYKAILKWVYDNKDWFSECEVSLLLIAKDGQLHPANELYAGAEYDNELGERLFGQRPELLLSDISRTIGSRKSEKEDIKAFIKSLGVETKPRFITKRIFESRYSLLYGQFVHSEEDTKCIQDYIKKNLLNLKYPYFVDAAHNYSNSKDLYDDIHTIRMTYYGIDQLDWILDNVPTKTILDWVKADQNLQRHLYDKKEPTPCNMEIAFGSQQYERKVKLAHAYSYVYYRFQTKAWVEKDGERYMIDDCLIELPDDVNLAPLLVGIDAEDYIEGSKGRNALKKNVNEIFEKIGFKRGFGDRGGFSSLPLSKIYMVLNRLSQVEAPGIIAKRMYESVLSTDYSDTELESCIERKTFLKEGKILTNNGYKELSDSYYLADKRIVESILDRFNIICVSPRKNIKRVKDFFGVDRLELVARLVDDPIVHPYQPFLSGMIDRFKPLAFILRSKSIKTEKEQVEESRRFRRLLFTICSTVNVQFNNKYNEELRDYEFVIPSKNHIYIKIPQNADLNHNASLADAVAEAICSCLDISELAEGFRALFLESNTDLRIDYLNKYHNIDREEIDLGLKTYSQVANGREDFNRVVADLTGINESDISKMTKAIDFNNLEGKESIKRIIRLFRKLKIDIYDYNNDDPQVPLDLTRYYAEIINRTKRDCEALYKSMWYRRLIDAPLSSKKTLEARFKEYDSINCEIHNSVYFKPEEAILSAIGLTKEYRKIEIIDFAGLYNKNKEVFRQMCVPRGKEEPDASFWDSNENMSLLYYGEYEALSVALDRISEKEEKQYIAEAEEKESHKCLKEAVEISPSYSAKEAYRIKSKVQVHTGSIDKRNEKEREKTGLDGEKEIYNLLCSQPEFSKVEWVSENAKKEGVNPDGSSSRGYDIFATRNDGTYCYIEVKSSVEPVSEGIHFFMSDNEYEFAMLHSKEYVIYYVGGLSKGGEAEYVVLNDVFIDGQFNSEKYSSDCERKYRIYN